MSYEKRVKYKNELGQELIFDDWVLFCESIDTTGVSGIFNSESLAFSDGQVTTDVFLGAKTIPCSFAFKDIRDDIFMRDKIAAVFSPTVSGVLTVYSEWDKYEIDVRPSAVPSFQRDKDVPYVWRWDVDFIADFPYWRVGAKRSVSLESQYTSIRSHCPLSVPIEIYFPPSTASRIYINVNGKGFVYNGTNCDVGVVLDARNFTCTGTDGNDYSHKVDVTVNIESLKLRYGKNTISCPTYSGIIVSYYYLSTGVF